MPESAHECYEHLLASLAHVGMAWVADEIRAEIAAGRIVEKEVRERGKMQETGLSVEEYRDDERLAIALRIVWERVQVAYAVWIESSEYLRLNLNIQNVTTIDVESGQPYEPFTSTFAAALSELRRTLLLVASECGIKGFDVDRLLIKPGRTLRSTQ